MKIPYSLNCRGRLLSLEKPIVMGIVNVTPDSFYEPGTMYREENILQLAAQMIVRGATILDIGGMSSRPGAAEVSPDEELSRVIPIVQKIRQASPGIFISIDTYRPEVAAQAAEAGADIINDISAAEWNPGILDIAAAYRMPYIAMHMQGRPDTMQQNPQYENVSSEIFDFFVRKIEQCKSANVFDVVADVGFGFGKTVEHNYELLAHLPVFKNLHKPLLAGVSRKSMICKPLKVDPKDALNGTTALHMIALQNGADILRVHDVKEAAECIKLFEIYREHSVPKP